MSTFQPLNDPVATEAEPPRFLTPAEVARMFRVSKMTIYRAIRDGDLPAVPMRGRWAVPARAINTMERIALARLGIGEATVDDRDVGEEVGRPRPGANQSGAGVLAPQQVAGREVSSTTHASPTRTRRGER